MSRLPQFEAQFQLVKLALQSSDKDIRTVAERATEHYAGFISCVGVIKEMVKDNVPES